MEAFVRTSDGANLWTTTAGQGDPIVLLNGGPGMADYLQPVSALLEAGNTVHRFEPRGCGRSSRDEPYTVARSVADLEDLRRHWKYDRWFVMGHSWGLIWRSPTRCKIPPPSQPLSAFPAAAFTTTGPGILLTSKIAIRRQCRQRHLRPIWM